ncbi:MAG TPA: hypothetical protein PK537_00300 [Candidatus Limiplasma sp.]|nr:hypothetical protein [Candidatus Limiplasma sp.]
MKKLVALTLALLLTFGVSLAAFADSDNSGAPVFTVSTSLVSDAYTIRLGETANLTATTTFTSQKNSQQLHLGGEDWVIVNESWSIPYTASGRFFEREAQFVSTAEFSSNTPGTYTITYTITVMHDRSDKRTYTTTSSVTITVEGNVPHPV